MKTRMKNLTVLIKPTHDCNMSCEYCFVTKLTTSYRKIKMDIDMVNHIYKVASNSAEDVNIIWHGGEPTLMGVEFYKKVIELGYLYADKTKFNHSIQTNGLLLNKDWGELVNNYPIEVSTSFDGLAQDGRELDSQDKFEKILLDFKDYAGGFGAIHVITKNSYSILLDNYKYFRDLGIGVSFNYAVNHDVDNVADFEEIDSYKYLKEYSKYYKYWVRDKEGYRERSASLLTNLVLGNKGNICTLTDCRKRWFSVNPDGKVYHCNRYYPEKYCAGNIKDMAHVDDIYNSDGYSLMVEDIQRRLERDCFSCEYFGYCNGGCNSNHLLNKGDISTTDVNYCNRFKSEFLMAYKVLKGLNLYNEMEINPYIKEILLEGRYLFSEIKEFLLLKGFDFTHITLQEDDLLNSKEFKLFEIFNRRNFKGMVNHIDMIIPKLSELSDIKNIIEVKNIRFGNMEKIFENSEEEITKLFQKGGNNEEFNGGAEAIRNY